MVRGVVGVIVVGGGAVVVGFLVIVGSGVVGAVVGVVVSHNSRTAERRTAAPS